MAFSHGSETRKALSFAVERDNLLQCYDAFESTSSTHFPDMAGVYTGSAAIGSPVLNQTDGWGTNKIKYFTLDGSDTFLFQRYTQPYTCSLSTWIRVGNTGALEVIQSVKDGGPAASYYGVAITGHMVFGYYDSPWRTAEGSGSGTNLTGSVWHHCVFARGGTNHKFYVDFINLIYGKIISTLPTFTCFPRCSVTNLYCII